MYEMELSASIRNLRDSITASRTTLERIETIEYKRLEVEQQMLKKDQDLEILLKEILKYKR